LFDRTVCQWGGGRERLRLRSCFSRINRFV
jgi:hypothetical protein